MAGTLVVDCPTCGRKVPWTPQSLFRPFCSQRCRTTDLGDWASGKHVIPGNGGGGTDAPEGGVGGHDDGGSSGDGGGDGGD